MANLPNGGIISFAAAHELGPADDDQTAKAVKLASVSLQAPRKVEPFYEQLAATDVHFVWTCPWPR